MSRTDSSQPSASPQGPGKSTYFDISDHPVIWRWMMETARRDPESFGMLVQDNTRFFKGFLGKANWRQKGGEWTHRWVIPAEGLYWLIQTGPAGTVFRLRSNTVLERFRTDPAIGVGAIAHLKELLSRISGVQG